MLHYYEFVYTHTHTHTHTQTLELHTPKISSGFLHDSVWLNNEQTSKNYKQKNHKALFEETIFCSNLNNLSCKRLKSTGTQ